MPSIQVTGQLVDPTTGVEGSADIRIASVINYGQTTKKSISHKSTDASGNYDFQLVYGKHLIFVKYEDERIYIPIGYAVVGDSTPDPIDLIQLINLSDENPPSELVTELQQLREDTLNDIVDTSAQVLENAGYKGLWPDTGGGALKGETWQTQVGGTPTGEYYTALQNTSLDPVGDDVNWKVDVSGGYVNQAQEELLPLGSDIFPENGTIKDGDEVQSGTTHLRVLVNGKSTIVAMSPVATGLVSELNEDGATIGIVPVKFYPDRKLQFYSDANNSAVENMLSRFAVSPLSYAVGTLISTGYTTWVYKDATGPVTLDNFRAFGAISVEDFNPKGFPNDDSDALIEAFEACAKGYKLIIPNHYAHGTTIPCVTSGVVDFEFIGHGKIETLPSLTSGSAMWISHLPYLEDVTQYYDPANRSGGATLSANADKLDIKIEVSDGSIFEPGGYVYIISTEDWLASASIKKGENRRVNSVNGNVITLDGGLDDSYISGITTCYPYNPPRVSIRNANMIGANDGNNLIGMNLYECASVTIDSPTVEGYNLRCMQFYFVVGGVISNINNDFSDKAYTSGGRSSYSLVINGSRDISVLGGCLRGGRHAFSTGGYIPNYNINVDGLKCYSSNAFGNDVACFDTHEGTVNLNVQNCTIYGGIDCAGENMNISNNEIFISGNEDLRALVTRQYRDCDYIITENNKVTGIDCSGGIVHRPRANGLTLNKLSQKGNDVTITTKFNRPGIGVEPTDFTGCVIINHLQDDNNVVVRGTATLAVGIGNYDLYDLSSLIDVLSSSCKSNTVYNECGVAIDHYFAQPRTANYYGNRFESAVSDKRAINIRNVKHLLWDGSHSFMSNAALAANAYNLFRDVIYLDINGGSFTNSYYNGYRLINVAEHNPVNVKRLNCVVNPSDFTRINAKFTPHSWACVDGATGNAKGETLNCTISKQGSGHYRMTFIERQVNGTDYPVFVSPETSIGYTVTRINFNAVDVVFDGGVDTNFSIETR